MNLISFDAFRTLGLPGVRYIKPERMYEHLDEIARADWLLFPEYWQINTLVYGLKKRIFPSLASYHLGHDKVEQTRAFLAVCPAHVPPTQILGTSSASLDRVEQHFGYPMIVKRIKSSMGEGVIRVENREQLQAHARQESVLYAQEPLPIDRDLRIVMVGGEILAAYWRLTPPGGYRSNVSQGGTVSHDNIPEAALALVRRVARDLDINHAGFDVAMAWDHPFLFEFNRLFGNQGIPDSARRIGQAILRSLNEDDDDMDPTGQPPFGLTG
ncbi:hypothetical protein GCM10027040_10310 [Halomonas shantousis]